MTLRAPVRRTALLAALACSLLPAVSAGQTAPIGLRVFADIDFRGLAAGFVRDAADLGPTGLAAKASSLQVASGEVWEVCTESNFRGRCRTVTEDVDDLRRGGWNDVIASVRRLRGPGARFFGPGPGRPSVSGLHLFGDINYRGASATLTSNSPDLERQGMARMVSSVRVDPDEVWEVCTEPGFAGRCMLLSEDQSDLRRGNWNDVIASARRVRAGGPAFGNTGFLGGLELFPDINFRGRSVMLAATTPDVRSRGMGGRISSLRVAPGEIWEVCTETNFRGRCDVVFEDMSDLRRGAWNDAILSARRVR